MYWRLLLILNFNNNLLHEASSNKGKMKISKRITQKASKMGKSYFRKYDFPFSFRRYTFSSFMQFYGNYTFWGTGIQVICVPLNKMIMELRRLSEANKHISIYRYILAVLYKTVLVLNQMEKIVFCFLIHLMVWSSLVMIIKMKIALSVVI